MRPILHCITPSEALRRVFLSTPKDATTKTYAATLYLTPSPSPCLHSPHPSPLRPLHPRPASTSATAFRPFGTPSPSPTQFGPKDSPPGPKRDEEIFAYRVYMVRPDDSRLPDPQLLADVLSTRERDEKGKFTQFVQEVSPPTPERPYPVCRMYDKKAAREAEEAKRKAARAAKRTNRSSKQLEMNWTVSDNDLGYRIARMKEFLEKGWKVEVVFGSQRKHGWAKRREASEEEARGVLEKIRSAVGEVQGAQEKEMQGTVGKEAILYFERRGKK